MKKILLLFAMFLTYALNAQVANQPSNIEICDDDTDGIVCVDLTIQNAAILGSQNSIDYTITYHISQADADADLDTVTIPFCNTTTPQTIFVRLEDNLTGMFDTTHFEVIVNSLPSLPDPMSISLSACDDLDNIDGFTTVDLTVMRSRIASGSLPSYITMTYFESETDAFMDVNPIANPTSYTNTSINQQLIWVRVTRNLTGCYSVTSFFFIVNPPLSFQQLTPLEACDTDGDGFATFALNTKIEEIVNGLPDYRVRFYESQIEADLGGNTAINSIHSFINTVAYAQTIYVRIDSSTILINNLNCSQVIPLELIATPTICNAAANETTYETEIIPYQLYDINTTDFTTNYDDSFSDIIDISFDFDFFGQTYNQITVGTNGIISFNTSSANGSCAWSIPPELSLPSANLFLNAILGVYHDLDDRSSEGGVIGYAMIGEAPYRKMIVFFDEVNQFSLACEDLLSTTQIILYETLNIIDIQIKQKIACTDWNNGYAIVGIQNATGNVAYFPEDRNSGVWDAFNEGHRFRPEAEYENVFSVYCDDDSDGFLNFDLTAIENDVLGDISLGTITYYGSEDDLLNNTNPLPLTYTNISNAQKIYARIVDGGTSEVTIKTVTLSVISCTEDYDLDGVDTLDEDVNQDGNLGNDDTDGDGIPDFIDEDDDGDYVLTNLELINTATGLPENGFLDTDNDMIPNHRDADDDGDGTLTIDEDYNGNNNPEDDDTNNNNIPDYLDTLVFLDVDEFAIIDARVYPNPVKDKLIIETVANVRIKNIEIYSVDGRLVHAQNQAASTNNLTIDVRNFASGFYLLRIQSENNAVLTKRFIVE